MEPIVINDPTIISYYRENPHIDIVTINQVFIDILKNLSTNLTNTMTSTINSKILNVVTDMQTNLTTMKLDIIMKIMDIKKEYIEDIKNIISNLNSKSNEYIISQIERSNDTLLAKTTNTIYDILPKSQNSLLNQIETSIQKYSNDIINDTQLILQKQNNENNNELIIDKIERNIHEMVNQIQQPIIQVINSNEERTNNNLSNLSEKFNEKQNYLNNNYDKLSNDINDFLGKYKNNSQFKGAIAETELYNMLQNILPSDEIENVSGNTASCDFKVNRLDKDKPTILFESKDYSRNVPKDEIEKFERDLQIQKYHGIMVSQRSPITYKNPFQIDIINGIIHVYVPNVEYNTDKLKIAIDIIDNLHAKLAYIQSKSDDEEHTPVSKTEIDDIVEEYRLFGIQKSQMVDTIKNVTKQLVDKLDEIQLPKIKSLLIKARRIENDNELKCSFCNKWNGKNKASLAAHMRNCKLNPKNNKGEIVIQTDVSN